MPLQGRRELFLVVAFVCLLWVPFLGKAYHIDEPFFLAIAGHILEDPWHPLDFAFNWYGRLRPMAQLNNTPPTLAYLLALGLKLTGGQEWLMRLLFLPLDLCAACALYLIAARFLARPLGPTLIVLAAPAALINMNHLMAEKLVAGLAFPCLYALLRGVDEDRPRWYWASALLCALALLSKYAAAFLLLPALGYSLERRVGLGRIAAYLGLALSGLAGYFLYDLLGPQAAWGSAWRVTAQTSEVLTAAWAYKLRSLLAFIGGCGVVTAFWPYCAFRPRGWMPPLLLAGVLLLFAPALDAKPLVRSIDRWTGVVLSSGAAWGLWGFFLGPRRRGWALWAPWALGILVLLALYWSVTARLVLFLLPPLVFGTAEILEERWEAQGLERFYRASLAATAALSLSLAAVDYRYAQAQKEMARQVARRHGASGRKIWCASHWGLQYYLEKGGAEELDLGRGGWDLVRPGQVVVLSRANSNVLRPRKPLLSNVTRLSLEGPIPLRLISAWTGEGGFYSNVGGFLPYSLSAEPLDEFTIVEAL